MKDDADNNTAGTKIKILINEKRLRDLKGRQRDYSD